jgi:hypothetical protein
MSADKNKTHGGKKAEARAKAEPAPKPANKPAAVKDTAVPAP